MLPLKIASLIRELREKTESNRINWNYDNQSGAVSVDLQQPDIFIAITYRFDTIEEVGTFRIDLQDRGTGRDLIFTTTQNYNDFELVRALYDSAQVSGVEFSF